MWFRSWFDSPIPPSRRPKSHRARRADQRRRKARWLSLEGLENRRLMAFTLLAEYPVGPYPSGVILAPIDAGSQLDMVTANAGNASVSFLAGHGNGAFDIPPTASPTLGAPRSLASGDFDGDGVADLVTAGDTSLSSLKGNGDGSFRPPVAISVPWQPIATFPRVGPQPQYLNSIAIGQLNK